MFVNSFLRIASANKHYLPGFLKTSYRNAWILKRRVEPPLHPRHVDTEKVHLEDIYHEYLEVEQTDDRPREPIKVVLTEFVEDVGKRGQIVEVDPIDGYMEYILTGRALYATPRNIARQKVLSESEIGKHSSITAFKTMKMLKSITLSVYMNMNEPWTIEPWHIRVMLRQRGIQLMNDDCIKLPETPIKGPNMEWEGKDFVTTVKINNCEQADIRCRLRHWTRTYSERIVLPPNHECMPSDPIFPEQKEILDNLPLPIWSEAN